MRILKRLIVSPAVYPRFLEIAELECQQNKNCARGLHQYSVEPCKQQQFRTACIEGVKADVTRYK